MAVMPGAYGKCTDRLPISMFPSAHQRISAADPGCSHGVFNSEHRAPPSADRLSSASPDYTITEANSTRALK